MYGAPLDLRTLGRYYALAQVGLEMVTPVAAGALLDYYFGWMPWCTVIGALVGFVGGMGHLIVLLNRRNHPGPPTPGPSEP